MHGKWKQALLHMMVDRGDEESLALLLSRGADPNVVNQVGGLQFLLLLWWIAGFGLQREELKLAAVENQGDAMA